MKTNLLKALSARSASMPAAALAGTLLAGTLAPPAQAVTAAGSYLIEKPTAVTNIFANPVLFNRWLNAVNYAPLTPTQAFITFGDPFNYGLANQVNGIWEFTFDPIVNGPGADIALFEGFLPNGYDITSDYDGFTAVHAVAEGDFSDTGEDRTYFFGDASPVATYDADILEAVIDLSDLGVPDGVSITKIRLTGTGANNDYDLIAIGAIVPEPASLSLLGLGGLALLRRRAR